MSDADVRADAPPGAGTVAGPPSRRRYVPLAVLIGVLITQFAWAWSTPPFRGADEIDHVFRAAAVARGDVDSTRQPADGRGMLVEVPPRLAADARAQCETLDYDGPSNCVADETLPNGDVLIASASAGYSPVFYAVVGTVAKPWDGATSLYVMRGVASLITAVLLAIAAWCLMTRSRTGWPLAGLLVALTPMALYTSMLPAPNGSELAAAAVLWCALLGLQGADSGVHGRLFAAAGAAGVILGSVRMTGPVFILLISAFVVLLDPRRTWQIVRSRWKESLAVAGATLGATLYQLDWAIAHPPLREAGTERVALDMPLILEQVMLWPFQWIGAFPYRNQPASLLTYVATGALLLVVFARGLRRGGAARWVAVGVLATCLVVPFLYTLRTFPELGTWWQGRYALPLLIGAPIVIGVALDRTDHEFWMARWFVPLLGLVSSSAAMIHVVNLELARPASADDPHWHAPATIALVLLLTVSAAAFERALVWAGSPSRSSTRARVVEESTAT